MGDFEKEGDSSDARRAATWASVLVAVLAAISDRWTRGPMWLGAFGVLLMMAVPGHTQRPAQTPLITVLEPKGRIAVSIPPSTSAKATMTFRIRGANASVKDITFLPTDMVTADGKRIPRQKLTIAGSTIDAQDKDFTLVVDGADTLGKFTGQLLARSSQVPGAVQPIDVAITVAPAANPAFPSDTKLKLQLAESCDAYTGVGSG